MRPAPAGKGGVAADGTFPSAVYQHHAYGNNREVADPQDATFLATHGNVVLQCGMRGTGGSLGEWSWSGPDAVSDHVRDQVAAACRRA